MKVDYTRYQTGELQSILAWAKQVANRLQLESSDGESLVQEHNRIERTLVEMVVDLGRYSADACLIAAAPELLAALKEMAEYHGSSHRDGCPCDDTCDCDLGPFNARVNNAINKAESQVGRHLINK